MAKQFFVNQNIKNTKRIFPDQGRSEYLRLDMNEGVLGLPKEFVDSCLGEITPEFLTIYPEPDRFLKKYSKFINVPTESLLATNGTDMAIRYILETFGEPGKDVVTVNPTFEMYRINCSILGLNHVPVNYEMDFSISAEKIIENISDDTRVVVLINPNNPIGNTYSKTEARQIFDAAKSHGAIVIVDEAYHYFTKESLLSLSVSGEYDNVIVLRTFSKLMSLAALRLGVVISNPEIIRYLKNGKLTFDVNSVALLFGERLLDHPEIIEEMIETERIGKDYLLNWLCENDYEHISCKGNYVLVKTKCDPHELTKRLEKDEKILVHDYGNPMLSEYIRISTADVESMKKVCAAIERLRGEKGDSRGK